MSLFKHLLKPFVEFDEAEKNAGVQRSPVAPPAPVHPSTSPVIPTTDANAQHPLVTGPGPVAATTQLPTYSPGGTITEPLPEHKQYFEKLIDEANSRDPLFQGTDFKEFIDGKMDIADITDETIRYKTAFTILKSTGLTKEKLLSTGQEYLNIIGHDLNAFQGAHARQYQKEVGQKEALIQKKAEELQLLTQQINALKGDINKLTQDITLTRDKLNTTKNSFLLAGENKQTEIQTELQKIARYF